MLLEVLQEILFRLLSYNEYRRITVRKRVAASYSFTYASMITRELKRIGLKLEFLIRTDKLVVLRFLDGFPEFGLLCGNLLWPVTGL